MGMYRTVWTEQPCLRCGMSHRNDLQIKVSEFDDLQDYEDGQRVPDDDDLEVGDEFTAWYDVYCRECLREWIAVHWNTLYKHLADYVASGEAEVRERASAEPLTAVELLQLGSEGPDWQVTDESYLVIGSIDIYNYDVTWHGHPPDSDESREFVGRFYEEIDQLMQEQGWEFGRRHSTNHMRVYVDSDNCIRTQPGEPLEDE